MRFIRVVGLLPWVLLGCTQDFDAYEPAADGSVVDVGRSDASAVDAAPDAPRDASVVDAPTTKDASADAPKDVVIDVPGADAGCTGLVYSGHCYYLVGASVDFDTAKNACTNSGGHLAALTTSAEQTTVQALGTGQRWIGLYRAGGPPNDGSFAWIDGEPRGGFANWGSGLPQGGGQCTYLQSGGTWANDACTSLRDAICERP